MTAEGFPEVAGGRPIWLITLADLALLLVGFFVFLQASQHVDRTALARGFRHGFGTVATPPSAPPPPMPVAAAAMLNFAPGAAALPASPAGLVAWAREAARDPRVTLTVTGSAGGAGDVDPDTGSAALLAADRARAVAAAIAGAVPAARLTVTTAATPGRRVVVTLGFAGQRIVS